MKKIFNVLILISILFSVSKIYSDNPPYVIWNKTYVNAASSQSNATALSTNPNGDLFLTGWFLGAGNVADIVTIKYNVSTGDTMWVKVFSTNLEDKPTSITSDNNFVYITGWSFTSTTSRDIITIKYDASTGDTIFVKRYNGTNNGGDYGRAITTDASGNVYITGRSDVVGQGQKYTTIKYDGSGNSIWTSTYTGSLSTNFDEALSIKVDASGNTYITGYCNGAVAGTSDILTVKIDGTNGTTLWAKRYNGPLGSEDRGVGIVLVDGGTNVIVGGYASRPALSSDFIALKYSAAGDSLGAIFYSSSTNIEFVNAMTKDNNDNIYLTGLTFLTGMNHYQTVRLNSTLTNVDWAKQTTELDSSVATSICYDTSGYVYVTGYSSGVGTGRDYLTIRYNASNGTEDWRKRENGASSGNDLASFIVSTGPDNVYLTGNSATAGGTSIYTLRYAQNPIGIRPISSNVPEYFNLEQNYPNPFNPVTNIRFDIPKASFVKIVVYDILGKEIAILVSENLKAGKFEADWNASGISSGVYFYKITAGDYTAAKKMILNK